MTEYIHTMPGPHVLIAGITGVGEEYGGKSVTANWWSHQLVEKGHADWGIYVNPKADSVKHATEVRTVEQLAEAFLQGENYVTLVPESATGEQEHQELQRFVNNLNGSKIVVHDEASFYGDTESLHWFTARAGNEANCRSIVIAQRAWDLPEQVLGNLPIKCWVGPTSPEAESYFKSMGMGPAWDDVKANTGPHLVNVIDGGRYVETFGPVPGEYA